MSQDNGDLFASVAVFEQLYNATKDIYDVISEFIVGAINISSLRTFSDSEITDALHEHFKISVPRAVAAAAIRKKLVSKGAIKRENGRNIINPEKIDNSEFSRIIEAKRQMNNELFGELDKFACNATGTQLTDSEIQCLHREFESFVLKDNGLKNYAEIIGKFAATKNRDEKFKKLVQEIKVGNVICCGLSHSIDINELGTWKTELKIFLDTEVVFDAAGLNGDIRRDMFRDFYEYVKEANASQKNRSANPYIRLRYFQETQSEIERYFDAAQDAYNNPWKYPPTHDAMIEILKGCKQPSDILVKKNDFYNRLKLMSIVCENYIVPNDGSAFYLGDTSAYEAIEAEFKNRFSDSEIRYAFSVFSMINSMRRGENNKGFERSKYFFVSGKTSIKNLSWSRAIRKENETPFTTSINYLTDRLWFRLKKGLSGNGELPKSFDISLKAKLVLEAQIDNRVTERYCAIKKEYDSGSRKKEDYVHLLSDLRDIALRNDDQSIENYELKLDDISNIDFDILDHVKSLTEAKIKSADASIAKVRAIAATENQNKKEGIKRRCRIIYSAIMTIYYMVVAAPPVLFFSVLLKNLLAHTTSFWDSMTSYVGTAFSFIVPIVGLLLSKKPSEFIKSKIKRSNRVKMRAIHDLIVEKYQLGNGK